jgi:hypothetical protein
MKREAPMIMLNLRYNFNNFREKRDGRSDESGFEMEEEF